MTLQKALILNVLKLMTGIEPVTSALPMRRTTDCATSAKPCLVYNKLVDMSIQKINLLS